MSAARCAGWSFFKKASGSDKAHYELGGASARNVGQSRINRLCSERVQVVIFVYFCQGMEQRGEA